MESSYIPIEYGTEFDIQKDGFIRKEDFRFSLEKRSESAFIGKLDIGNLNLETPLSFFLKKFYKQTMSSYVAHRQIYLNNNVKDINYIFLMKEDLLITTNFEDEKNITDNNFIKINPILLKIDYRSVIFLINF